MVLSLATSIQIYQPMQIVCSRGNLLKSVYLILSGEVAVSKQRKRTFDRDTLNEEKVAILNQSMSFGDLPVLYETPLTVSCVAWTKVIALRINGTAFKNIIGDYLLEVNRKRFRVLSQLRVFQGWERPDLGPLLNHLYLRSPQHCSYVYQKGDVNNNIYVVIQGEVEVTVCFKKKKGKEDKSGFRKRVETGKVELVSTKQSFLRKRTKDLVEEVPVLKLAAGSYFGDEDGFLTEEKIFSVKVVSNNCKLFLIPKEVSNSKRLKTTSPNILFSLSLLAVPSNLIFPLLLNFF